MPPKKIRGLAGVCAAQAIYKGRPMDSVILRTMRDGESISVVLDVPKGDVNTLVNAINKHVAEAGREVVDYIPNMSTESDGVPFKAERVLKAVQGNNPAAAAIAGIDLGLTVQWLLHTIPDAYAAVGQDVCDGGAKGSEIAHTGKKDLYGELVAAWEDERPCQPSDHATDKSVARTLGVSYKAVERARKKKSK